MPKNVSTAYGMMDFYTNYGQYYQNTIGCFCRDGTIRLKQQFIGMGLPAAPFVCPEE
jgi:hypothetical protein